MRVVIDGRVGIGSEEHRGAVVSACWAHNPAVLRSKLSGATTVIYFIRAQHTGFMKSFFRIFRYWFDKKRREICIINPGIMKKHGVCYETNR